MANEAVIIELQEGAHPVRFTCADGTAIPKGTLLKLSDPRTVAATSASNDYFAGIAATEKVASDGQTSIGVWVPGQNNIFDLYVANSTVTAGKYVVVSGANTVGIGGTADMEVGRIVGQALETSAAGTAETIAELV